MCGGQKARRLPHEYLKSGIFGPMPHSGSEKGDSGSIIAALESEAGCPPVVRLSSSGLKITKSGFGAKLMEMKELRRIA